MMEYEFHPLCLVLPEMPDERYQQLVEDIRAKGLNLPITLFEGKILDGRHRYKACLECGCEPRFETPAITDPVGFIASRCLHRDLTKSQRGLIAWGFLDYEQAQAKARQRGGQGGVLLVENSPQAIEAGKARDKAGERVGVSGKTVDQAAAVMERGRPEVVEMVRSGEMALNEAVKVIELKPESQKRIAAIEDKRERQKALGTTLQLRRTKIATASAQKIPELPGTPFVRRFLGRLELMTNDLASEFKLKTPKEIAERFLSEYEETQASLSLQFEHIRPLLTALELIHQDLAVRRIMSRDVG